MSTQRGSGSSHQRRNWSPGITVGSAVDRSSWAPTSTTSYSSWTVEDTPTNYQVTSTFPALTSLDSNSTRIAEENTLPVYANAPGEETTELVTSTISIESTLRDSQGSVTGTSTILSTSTGTVVRTIPPGPSSTSIPYSTIRAGASSQNVPAMIGGIVGGVIALILGATLIFCVVRRRRKRTIEPYNATAYPFSVAGSGAQYNSATSDWIQSSTSERRVSVGPNVRNTWSTFHTSSQMTDETLPSYHSHQTNESLPSYYSRRTDGYT